MARAWRIEYQGAYYHVLSRGNEQRPIFLDDSDRLLFLDLLGEFSARFDIDVFSYVLMDNHYHLLLRTQLPNLSKSMQWLGVTYTRRFNLKHIRSGHLFQGRFKSILIENDAYVMQLSCYIHRNPLRAKVVKRLADYRWSSYLAYAYGKKRPDWLKTDLILSQFNTQNSHRKYREKVQRYVKEEKRLWEDLRHGLFLGSKKFVDRIRALYLPDRPNDEIPQQKRMLKVDHPQIILSQAAQIFGYNLKRFRRSARISNADRDIRDMLIYLLWEIGQYTNQEIGGLFGLGYSSISQRVKMFKLQLRENSDLAQRYNLIKSQIKM